MLQRARPCSHKTCGSIPCSKLASGRRLLALRALQSKRPKPEYRREDRFELVFELGSEEADTVDRLTARRAALVVVTICYLAVLPMNKSKITKHTVATPDLDPATLAHLDVLKRQRQRANRVLLKRRRQKSGQ